MESWITNIMNEFGYIGILLLISIENIFPPIPSEVILTFGGFMTTNSELSIIGVVMVATLGSLIGAIILYGIGAMLEVKRLETIIEKYGKILFLTKKDIRKANDWFSRYGAWAVFFGRLVPLIRSLISIPAGSVRMNIAAFLTLTALGSFIWNVLLISIGATVGASWQSIVNYMDIYSNIVYVLILLLFLFFVFLFLKKRVFSR